MSFFFSYQYFSAHKNYNMAVDYFASQSKYRTQAVEIAKEQGLLQGNKKKDKHKTKVVIIIYLFHVYSVTFI